MKKELIVSICVGIMFLLSSCNTTENEVKTNENISAKESVVTCENYDSALESLSIPYVMSTVHDYLEKDYKKRNVRGDDFPGETLEYDVYYSKNGYIVVKIQQEEGGCNYFNGTYHIEKDLSIKNEEIKGEGEFERIVNDPDLYLLGSDELYVKTDSEVTYEDYEGKEEKLEEIKAAIYNHYFTYDEEPCKRPVFHESTSAEKVYLMDFDEGTKCFDLIIITEDGSVYEAYADYYWLDEKYEFRELVPTCTSLEAIEKYKETQEGDAVLAGFVDFYDYVMMHTACVVEP